MTTIEEKDSRAEALADVWEKKREIPRVADVDALNSFVWRIVRKALAHEDLRVQLLGAFVMHVGDLQTAVTDGMSDVAEAIAEAAPEPKGDDA